MTSSTKQEPSASCGHVFVLHCAASGFAADGLLEANAASVWKPGTAIEATEKPSSKTKHFQVGLPSGAGDALALFQAFLATAGEKFKGEQSAYRRGKPLLGLEPTSFLAGVGNDKAGVLADLMSEAYSAVDTYGVDVALCVPDYTTYVSAMNLRDVKCPFATPLWMLSEKQKKRVRELATVKHANRLAIFIGAGISIPSGGPSWGALLEQLADKAGYSEEDKEHLTQLDYLDQPTVLEEDLKEKFKPSVAELINEVSGYTPAHALLKTLQCPAVTTNYDCLYEDAAESCGKEVYSLPWDSRKLMGSNSHNSLLKLHGCVKHPESIILTRKDYMRYPDNYQALRGRLQGIFLTNEVLFCGFSMTDDNVHKIIDDVKKVVKGDDSKMVDIKLGTILSMTENKMFTRLWDQDFHLQSFGKSWGDNPAWYHDCFLDALVLEFLQQGDKLSD
mmetsp:Transcript_2710/g.6460  ORF Transcript_2710/g.6460 Transcript_2710/m.6460 type:complete len:447 (-) Transcript_2710:1978-3318(-)